MEVVYETLIYGNGRRRILHLYNWVRGDAANLQQSGDDHHEREWIQRR